MGLRAPVVAILCLTAAGCGKPAPPPVTEAGGIVLLNGSPLPNAQLQFVPDLADFGAELNSTGITDEKGRFQLKCAKNDQAGAVVAKHRVVITDAPPPPKYRGMSEDAQKGYAAYVKSLKNRPIPEQYGSVGTTPLIVEVKADQNEYKIELTR
jgi:hypothetical protein